MYFSFDDGVNDISLTGEPKSSAIEFVSFTDDFFGVKNRAIDFS